jgi:HSP20 family molecular chaperone IbpA
LSPGVGESINGRETTMATLVPRWFGDLADLIDVYRPTMPGRMFRVEDSMTDQEYRIRAELPGMDPDKDIHVSVDNGVLTIHAERRMEETTHGHSEFHYGTLQRSVRLPGNADADEVKASYDKGILEVVVPLKADGPAGRRIPIIA